MSQSSNRTHRPSEARKIAQRSGLTTRARKALPAKAFGLPKERKYPMPDKSHARNAKARASEMYNKGQLSGSQKSQIDRKADRKLRGK